jgi:hypothetical protein
MGGGGRGGGAAVVVAPYIGAAAAVPHDDSTFRRSPRGRLPRAPLPAAHRLKF